MTVLRTLLEGLGALMIAPTIQKLGKMYSHHNSPSPHGKSLVEICRVPGLA